MPLRKWWVMDAIRIASAVCWIILQLLLPASGHGRDWDRRRAESTLDNRVYVPSAYDHSFWSSWAEWQPCSRTCGGGVSNRIRYCQPRHRSRPEHCPGDSKQYRLCNTQACPREEMDFRQKQCANYNNRYIAGQHTRRWVPAQGHHGCDLKCRSVDHGTVYTFGKANDSTPCQKNGGHVCQNGRCMEVGCDLLLGSTRRLDACGVCGGRNESCTQVRGNYVVGTPNRGWKVPDNGYEQVTMIPAGSTRIYVTDTSSKNYLALADSRRKLVVNGGRDISWPGIYTVAGTLLNYTRQWQVETFHIEGPTKEDIYLMLLVYDKNAHPVRYEYWSPTESRRNDPRIPERPTRPPYPSRPHPNVYPYPQKNNTTEERVKNRSYPENPSGQQPRTQPEPREGPGRNPEDYKEHGDPYAHRDPRHQNPRDQNRDPRHQDRDPRPRDQDPSVINQIPSGRNPGAASSNDPRYYPEERNPSSRNDPRTVNDPSVPVPRERPNPGNRPKIPTKGRCPPCKRVNEKVKNFCDSEFVVRARVLDFETVGQETRYDLGIVESYKNTVYMSHREYVWSPAVEGALGPECRCPRLRRNQDYVLMGHLQNYKRTESRLVITAESYVRKALPKRDLEMKKLKKVAARKCKRE